MSLFEDGKEATKKIEERIKEKMTATTKTTSSIPNDSNTKPPISAGAMWTDGNEAEHLLETRIRNAYYAVIGKTQERK